MSLVKMQVVKVEQDGFVFLLDVEQEGGKEFVDFMVGDTIAENFYPYLTASERNLFDRLFWVWYGAEGIGEIADNPHYAEIRPYFEVQKLEEFFEKYEKVARNFRSCD
jgi:hypothetical protein